MILRINPDWRVTTDRYNWTAERRTVAGPRAKEPGADVWVPTAYFGTLTALCAWFVRHSVQASDAQTLEDALAQAEIALKDVLRAVRKHFPEAV